MEIDKRLVLRAPPQQVWALLLDPQAMGACVPGMESIEVVSPDEYVALMRVKIAFISARFKLRTRIVERQEPHHLIVEGTGEDASVASSLKQRTEMRLAPVDGDGTELQMRVQVDVLGRMGTFGLAAMKTKADRLWDEFGINLAARLAQGEPGQATPAQAAPAAQAATTQLSASPSPASPSPASPAPTSPSISRPSPARQATVGWWPRLLCAIGVQPVLPAAAAGVIVVEVRRPDHTHIRIEWPAKDSDACAQWLHETLR